MSAGGRTDTASLSVIQPRAEHRAAWERLYAGYADFYRVSQTPSMRELVWGWIHDPAEEVECLLAVDDLGEPVGMAHFRQFARPLAAARGCYLDDLFVAPSARGSGAAESLLDALRKEAQRRGWSVIRWITADDNYRARGFYDKLARRTPWLTYDLEP